MKRKDLLDLAGKFGTPLYVYDASKIQEKFHQLENIFSGMDHELHYAMKANENPAILEIIKALGGGIDAVSPNEIKRALKVGFKPEDIVFTPSFPDEEEIEFAITKGVNIHIGDTYLLEFILDKYPDYPIGLRINPETKIEGNQKIATAHGGSKFGIPLNDLAYIQTLVAKGLKINTLHIHTGSDVKKWEDLARSAQVVFDLLKVFPGVKKLDLGSGFKVKYSEESPQIDMNAYASYLKKTLKEIDRDIKLIFEPGKYLVSEAGYFLVKVNGVKKGYEKTFAGVNSGFHHFIRPMYYDAYHEIVNLTNPGAEERRYDIVGQLCEEDTFAYNRNIPEIRKGDILAIKNAGAYAFSMASDYNMRDKPKEILWKNNAAIEISI